MPRTFYFYLFLPPNPAPFNLGEQVPTQPQRGQSHRAQSSSCCSDKTPRHRVLQKLQHLKKKKNYILKPLRFTCISFSFLIICIRYCTEYLAMCYIKYSGSILKILLIDNCSSLVVFILALLKISLIGKDLQFLLSFTYSIY